MSECREDTIEAKSSSGCCAPTANRGAATAVETAPPTPATALSDGARSRMIDLPGGTFLMGSDYAEGFPKDGEGPVRPVRLRPFSIDTFPVTNKLFRSFIEATGYQTEAERFGWSFVFWLHIPREKYRELVKDTVAVTPWWCKVLGAAWDTPEGPGSNVLRRENHPVVHVSWNDANAFAQWNGQRLLTEAQWEYAARGGLAQKLYPWGDKLRPDGEHLCNIWQGDFPNRDTANDGYAGTSPVDAYLPNGYGIYSITGNTWEWCADWFDAEFHRTTSRNDPASRDNPTGPPAGTSRVMKGGSFLCHKSYCNRYRVAARTSNTPDSSASNVGFRCAM